LRLAIETLEGRHIGSCGLDMASEANRTAELGIMIGEKDCWGLGYGTDAIVTLCGLGFRQLNLHRVGLCVFPFNPRGQRCYEKCGFQVEGRQREAVFKHGQYHDIVLMGILREEFAAKFPER
jgi:RimJ/RimL family protein N-acetyltransferase